MKQHVLFHFLFPQSRQTRFGFRRRPVQTFLGLFLNRVREKEGKFLQQIGMILKQMRDLFQNFLDTPLFPLVIMQYLQERVINIGIIGEPALNLGHV